MKKLIMGLCLSCALLTQYSFAGQTAEDVTAQYLTAVNQKGLPGTVQYFHPDELNKFKSAFVSVFENTQNKEMIQAFFGKNISVSELKKMPADLFTEQMFGTLSKILKTEDIHFDDSKILGSVQEGELKHLLVRQFAHMNSMEFSSVQIVTLKPYQDSWKLMFSDKLDTMVKAMQAGLAAKN